jgi:hypothetical protein
MMTKAELKAKLETIRDRSSSDPEADHVDADVAVLEYIDDEEITALFEELAVWYA